MRAEYYREISKEKLNKESLFKNKNFIFLFIGNTFTNFTMHFLLLALPIIIYDITKSTLAMGTMRAIEVIPNILLGMIIGYLIDKFKRKKILIIILIIEIIVLTILFLMLFTNSIKLWHLYVIGFFIFSCGSSLSTIYHTVIPSLVRDNQLTTVNSLRSFIVSLNSIIGPLVAGLLIVSFSYYISISISIVGLSVMLILSWLTAIPNIESNSKGKITTDIVDGWKILKQNYEVLSLTYLILLLNVASTMSGAVIIFYVLDDLLLQGKHVGFILSSAAVGSLLASIFAKKSIKKVNRGTVFVICLFLAVIAQLTLFLSSTWISMSLAMILMGVVVTLTNIHYFTLRQQKIPGNFLGRVTGTCNMIVFIATPISYLVSGYIAEYIETKFIFLISTIMLIIMTSIVLIKKNILGIK